MAELLPELFIALYVDEDVTDALAPALRERGFKAQSTIEAGRLAQPDDAQLEICHASRHGDSDRQCTRLLDIGPPMGGDTT